MNIQIFGTNKCFDTKKAQRYFKERGVRFQMIDLKEKGMSRGEFENVARALGGWEKLVGPAAMDQQPRALRRVGAVTVVRAGGRTVANLFDDTQQRQEYEDKLEGLVLFDPVPFDGIENIDDLTLREAAVWGCVYSIQETQGGFDNSTPDPDTAQPRLPTDAGDAPRA